MPRLWNVASPPPPVVAVLAPDSVAPGGPETICACTEMPEVETGLPLASASCTRGWTTNGVPLDAVDDGCRSMRSRPAEPTVAVELNVTGEPSSPDAVATVDCSPAVAPRVLRTAERPSAPVATVVALTAPPPVTVQVTVTPATGLSLASVARTTSESGSAVPAVAVWASPDSSVRSVALEAPALALNVT